MNLEHRFLSSRLISSYSCWMSTDSVTGQHQVQDGTSFTWANQLLGGRLIYPTLSVLERAGIYLDLN